MDSDESYHSKSEFYYSDEMTNDNEKENIGAISNEENQKKFRCLNDGIEMR